MSIRRPDIPASALRGLGLRRTESGVWVPEQVAAPPAQRTPAHSGVEVFVPHGRVFPDLPGDFDEFKRLVRRLSRTDTVLWCARLNILVSDSTKADPKDVQGYCIAVFFSDGEIERINAFAKEHGGREHVSLFFRGQLLELLRWVVLLSADLLGDGETFNDPEVRRTFARAALLASEVWGRRIYRDRLGRDAPVDDVRRDVLPLIRLSKMESAPSPHPLMSLARGASLFADRLRALEPAAEGVFLAATGLSIDDYLAIIADIAGRGLGREVAGLRDPSQSGLLHANAYENAPDPLGAISREFFAREAQTGEELRRALWGERLDADESDAGTFDLLPLRNRPIFRAGDGRAIVLDPRSFVERASAGPLFQLVRADTRSALRWFTAFGDVFEGYAQDMLDRIYPHVRGLVRRFIRNPKARDESGNLVDLGDGLLLGDRVAVFFEMKGVWMKDSVVSADADAETYLHHIRERYGVVDSAAPGDRRVKGVGQLARAINRVADGSWKVEGVDLHGIDQLIPVLLVHDTHLDAPVHSHVLAQEFAAALGVPHDLVNWTESRRGRFGVAHLVLLTIDDLEVLETSTKNFALVDCLEQYAAASPDRLMSFHNFLATSPYRVQLRYNAWLATKCIDVLDRCIARLFPPSPTEHR